MGGRQRLLSALGRPREHHSPVSGPGPPKRALRHQQTPVSDSKALQTNILNIHLFFSWYIKVWFLAISKWAAEAKRWAVDSSDRLNLW